MTETKIDARVRAMGQSGDCPILELLLIPSNEIDGILLYTWTIGEKVKVIRDEL